MKLERELLYTEKSSLQDFLLNNALNLELHRLYKQYLAHNKCASYAKYKETDVLNEAYYQCTKLHNTQSRTYSIPCKDMEYVKMWYNKLRGDVQNEDAASFIACLVMGIFSVLPSLTTFEKVFLLSLCDYLRRNIYFDSVHKVISEFRKLYGAFSAHLSPTPISVVKLSPANSIDWRNATDNFSYERMNAISLRFPIDERHLLVSIMKKMALETHLSQAKLAVFEKLDENITSDKIIPNPDSKQNLENEYVKRIQEERDTAIKKCHEANSLSLKYKSMIEALKLQLGNESISLDLIAERILSLPSKARDRIFKDINTLLVGTSWDTKAKEVLTKIINVEKESEQELRNRPIVNNTFIDKFENQNGATYIDLSDTTIDKKALALIANTANKTLTR